MVGKSMDKELKRKMKKVILKSKIMKKIITIGLVLLGTYSVLLLFLNKKIYQIITHKKYSAVK